MSNSVQYAGSSPASSKIRNAGPEKPTDKASISSPDKFSQKIKDSEDKGSKAQAQQPIRLKGGNKQDSTSVVQTQTHAATDQSTYQLIMQQLTGHAPEAKSTGALAEKIGSSIVAETIQPKGKIDTVGQAEGKISSISPEQTGKKLSPAVSQTEGKISSATDQVQGKIVVNQPQEKLSSTAEQATPSKTATAATSTTVEQAESKAEVTTEEVGIKDKAETTSLDSSVKKVEGEIDTAAEQVKAETSTEVPWPTSQFGDETAISRFINQPASGLNGSKGTLDTNSPAERPDIAETTSQLIKQQLGSIEKLFDGQGLFSAAATTSQLIKDHLSGALAAEMAGIAASGVNAES